MLRKKGKLPAPTVCVDYGLEYGKDQLHVHVDAVKEGQRVLIFDDLLATGGTIIASAQCIRTLFSSLVFLSSLSLCLFVVVCLCRR